MYNQFTQEGITELKVNEIYVFTSYLEEAYEGGAALLAYRKFGADIATRGRYLSRVGD